MKSYLGLFLLGCFYLSLGGVNFYLRVTEEKVIRSADYLILGSGVLFLGIIVALEFFIRRQKKKAK